jgi:two-component system OmpR family sensor kinase
MRGQLVLWYLGVLAVLLLALGIFQTITLGTYLRSSTEDSLRHAAYQELGILGPCYLGSSTDLRRNAAKVARLLGGHDTAVTIVTPGGQILAAHGLGPPGATQPLHLSRATVRRLIGSTGSSQSSPATTISLSTCPQPSVYRRRGLHRNKGNVPEWANSLVSPAGLLLVAVPLGPPGTIVGYAILGRSLAPASATLVRVLLVFALGAAVALLLAVLVALPIINRALRPLRRVTETAEAIAGGDLEQRANLALSRDEVGRLGEAFDTMVDRLQAAIAERAASEERMRRFLADASHELRTPATVLRGASQVLLRQGAQGQPDLLAPLRDMHEEAIRLSRLVDDLLTLSRLDAGQQMAPQPVELRSFLSAFVDRYRSVWPSRTIHLDAGNLNGATARVDPEALRRMLTNLVDNAARYSRSDGAITITGEPAPHTVSIAVADEGPGLRSEDARQVFDRFYRANKSRSRDSGGTGLGLAIVHGLVEQSGGKIDMETGPDRGTTVTVTLPRASEAHVQPSVPKGDL